MNRYYLDHSWYNISLYKSVCYTLQISEMKADFDSADEKINELKERWVKCAFGCVYFTVNGASTK